MTGDTAAARDLQEVRTAEPRPGEPVEVTFSPTEPQLTLGAARAGIASPASLIAPQPRS